MLVTAWFLSEPSTSAVSAMAMTMPPEVAVRDAHATCEAVRRPVLSSDESAASITSASTSSSTVISSPHWGHLTS